MGACCSRYSTQQHCHHSNIVQRSRLISEATLDACEEVIDIMYGLRRFSTPKCAETDVTEYENEKSIHTTTAVMDDTIQSVYGTPMSQ